MVGLAYNCLDNDHEFYRFWYGITRFFIPKMKSDRFTKLWLRLEPIVSMARPVALGIMVVLILASLDYKPSEFIYWNE